tara:strand:+ start:113 stop:445 length:333 start_codon:yes stop_codon:yes gene_type:complete
MTSEMMAFLPLLISDFLEKHGQTLTISKTANPNCECLVISNLAANKVCLLGSLIDPEDNKVKIAASMVDLAKWQWGAREGFTTHQIINSKSVHGTAFKIVCPGDLYNLLV